MGTGRTQDTTDCRPGHQHIDPVSGYRRSLPYLYGYTRDGIDFNLAYIPPTFKTPHKEEFDTVYMRALYDVGYKMAEKGYVWTKEPPVLIPSSEEP